MTFGISPVPFPTQFARLKAGELAYHDVRPPEPVATAVFVPGYTGSKEDFALLVQPLCEARVRYVAIDQRGQFESVGPEDPAAYTVDALAAELVEFLRLAVDEPAHVVGHSFGGLVARAAAIAAPELFASLTLMGSGPAGLSGPRVDRMRALEPLLDSHGPEGVFEAVLAASPVRPHDELVAFLRRRWLDSSVTGLRAIGEAVQHERDRVDELRATGIRTAVVTGEDDDTWLPSVQREMAERLGAPFTLIRGSIHSPAAEQPAATAQALLGFWLG